MKYFFWYCLNTTVRILNNSNIGTINAIQKKFVCLYEMGEKIKSSILIKTLLQYVYSYLSFYLPIIQPFISTWEESYEDIYPSSSYVSVITGNILITIIRFSLTSSSCFQQTDWWLILYLGAIRICRNLNKHYYYLISTTSVIWQIEANMLPFHIKTLYLKLLYNTS